jgi:hypothetical protein
MVTTESGRMVTAERGAVVWAVAPAAGGARRAGNGGLSAWFGPAARAADGS